MNVIREIVKIVGAILATILGLFLSESFFSIFNFTRNSLFVAVVFSTTIKLIDSPRQNRLNSYISGAFILFGICWVAAATAFDNADCQAAKDLHELISGFDHTCTDRY